MWYITVTVTITIIMSSFVRSFMPSFACGSSGNMMINPLDTKPTVVQNQREPHKSCSDRRVQILIDDTDDWNMKTTIPFIAPVTGGKCIKCYDGDTITVATKMPFSRMTHIELANTVFRFSVRLAGIDCPEIKGKTVNEKALALVARDELKKKILNKPVILRNVMTEKYGRLLADVYVVENGREVWVNKWMLDEKHGVFYDGGTKKIPEEWCT